MREVSDKRRIALNIAATIVSSVTTAFISFFMYPFIVKTIGVEAQGYVQLATNFTSYVALVTIALNSMAGRFIIIAIQQNDIEKAGKYYTSVFWGNWIIFFVLAMPVIIAVANLDKMINIPTYLVSDVKLLFALVFMNFFASNLLFIWSNAFYVVNRLYLKSIGMAIASLLQAAIVFALFSLFTPKVYYSTIAVILASIFTAIWGLWHKNRLLPELKVKIRLYSFARLCEILSSGIWRSLQSVGEMLLSGLDLLICNLLIGSVMMGILALSKTVPAVLQSLNWQIAATFAPQLTIRYAKGDRDRILTELRHACKINAIVGTIPIAGLMVFGQEFFLLWVPGQDARMLHTLSILTCLGLLVVSGVQPIGNVFAAVNKVKPQAISVIISGIINTAVVFTLLSATSLGVYVIAGVSTIILLVRNVFFTVPFAARYLGFKWSTFFFGFGYSILGSIIVSAIGFSVKYFIKPDGWFTLIIGCVLTGVLGLFFSVLALFDRVERDWAWKKILGLKTKLSGAK